MRASACVRASMGAQRTHLKDEGQSAALHHRERQARCLKSPHPTPTLLCTFVQSQRRTRREWMRMRYLRCKMRLRQCSSANQHTVRTAEVVLTWRVMEQNKGEQREREAVKSYMHQSSRHESQTEKQPLYKGHAVRILAM